jgi:uncharacterized repeat protein (TIGR01451 family)
MKEWNLKGVLSRLAVVSSIGLFANGAAYATNTLTEAGTSVSNTFELSYEVDDVVQPIITNDPTATSPSGVAVQGTPTLFTVDRKVDLILTATNSVLSTPPGTTATLTFELVNEGNDTQAYSFSIEDLDTGGVTFDADSVVIEYAVDVGDDDVITTETFTTIAQTTVGAASGTVTSDVGKGVRVFINVTGTILASEPDGNTDDITLVAETRDPTAWAAAGDASAFPGTATPGAVTADSGGANTVEGNAQNVLADGTGVSDADTDGLFSATGVIEVESPNLTATKVVTAIKEPGLTDPFTPLTDCATATAVPNAKAIPGACVEYVITVVNSGSIAADTLVIDDILPEEVTFVSATFSDAAPGTGFDNDPDVAGAGPVLTAPTTPAASNCDGSTTCVIQLNDALLPAGRTGTITIRALVK